MLSARLFSSGRSKKGRLRSGHGKGFLASGEVDIALSNSPNPGTDRFWTKKQDEELFVDVHWDKAGSQMGPHPHVKGRSWSTNDSRHAPDSEEYLE